MILFFTLKFHKNSNNFACRVSVINVILKLDLQSKNKKEHKLSESNTKSTAGRKAFSHEKKELIRNNIIAAAEQLFTTIEFSDVSMQKIAEKAGIAKGSIYYYFKNKYDLYITIANRMFKDAYAEYQNAVDNEITYLDKFIAFNRIKLIFFKEHLQYLLLTNKLYYEMYKFNFEEISAETKTGFHEVLAFGYQMMRSILQGGKQNGEFRSDLDIEHLISEFAKSSRAMLNHSIINIKEPNKSDEFYEKYIANLVRILR